MDFLNLVLLGIVLLFALYIAQIVIGFIVLILSIPFIGIGLLITKFKDKFNQ